MARLLPVSVVWIAPRAGQHFLANWSDTNDVEHWEGLKNKWSWLVMKLPCTSLQTLTASSSGLLMIEHELGMRVDSHFEFTRFNTIRWHFAAIAGFSSQSKIRSAWATWLRRAMIPNKIRYILGLVSFANLGRQVRGMTTMLTLPIIRFPILIVSICVCVLC